MNLTDLSPYQALQEQLTSVVQEIGHLIDPIATAARGEAAQLGHKVTDAGAGTLLRVCKKEAGVVGEREDIDSVALVPQRFFAGVRAKVSAGLH